MQSKTRKAAFVFVDVANYAHLMEQDEVATHQNWMSAKSLILEKNVKKYSGVIIKSTGDGLLMSFQSPVNALQFSVNTQRQLADVKFQSNEIRLKIGINYGSAIVEKDDVYGSDVNIAARICSLASKDEILVSFNITRLTGSIDFAEFQELGFFAVKHIEKRVRIARVLYLSSSTENVVSVVGNRPSIAILPFKARQPTRHDNIVSYGLPISIGNIISSMNELFVSSTSSTIMIDDRLENFQDITHKLGVRYLLHGDYHKSDDTTYLNLELFDSDQNTPIWSNEFEFDRIHPLDTSVSLSSKVVYKLLPQVHLRDLSKSFEKKPINLDAYDYLIQGIFKMYKLTKRDFAESKKLFRMALNLDPHYSFAHSMMAMWYLFQVGEGLSLNPDADVQKSLGHSSRALDFSPSDPFALTIYGHSLSLTSQQYQAAIGYFEKAISACPNSAIAWGLSAPTYSYIGQHSEAVIRARKALELSPLEPYAYFYRTALTLAHYFEGNYEEAVFWGRKTFQSAPNFVANLRLYIASLIAIGSLEEGKEMAAKLLKIVPRFQAQEFCKNYPIASHEQKELLRTRLIAASLPN